MQEARAQRLLGLAGLVFVALVIVAVVTTTTMSSHASAAKVVASVHQHKSALMLSAFVVGLAVFEALFFFCWYLREYLCDVASNRRLATIAYAGVVLFAVSGTLGAGVRFSMADAVGHVDPVVLQTLNVLQNDLNTFVAGAGVAVFLVANGIAIIRNGPLPTLVGWVGVVLGVLAGAFGAPAAALWIVIASIVILVRANQATPASAT